MQLSIKLVVLFVTLVQTGIIHAMPVATPDDTFVARDEAEAVGVMYRSEHQLERRTLEDCINECYAKAKREKWGPNDQSKFNACIGECGGKYAKKPASPPPSPPPPSGSSKTVVKKKK